MVFFSFSLNDDSFSYLSNHLESNQIYFSKDTVLLEKLNNKKYKSYVNFLTYEKRKKINNIGKKLLICLPPNFGLGDAIEYSIAIKSITESKIFSKIGIAFCGKHDFIFKTLFSFLNTYTFLLSEKEMNKYDTIFHITLEVEALKFQKYKRTDIVLEICKYFNIPVSDFKFKKFSSNKKNIKKISIFPVSTSVLRSLPLGAIESINNNFVNNFKIEIFLDNSNYSNYLKKNFFQSRIIFKNPKNIENLIKEISEIELGIFVDSGPLHIAKLFDKKGILIETSVSSNILLNNSENINVVKNKYKSNYCSGSCGLVDVFSINKKIGCYETTKMSFEDIMSLKNLKQLQRWDKKVINPSFISNPVGCVKKIDIGSIIKNINLKLRES